MWYWYLRAQELANERYEEARSSRLGRLAQVARLRRRTNENIRAARPLTRRTTNIG